MKIACFSPIKGYRSRVKNKNGKYFVVFNRNDGYEDLPIILPCGKCIGCRLERSRQWAIRIMHESSLHEESCFVTLTYNDEYLPSNGSLVLNDFQKFMKRLRMEFKDKKIRFFHCGEYGGKLGRPHYHVCIFGIAFNDRVCYNNGEGVVYASPTLSKLWPFGFSSVGELSFESASYVARYITKKITGDKAIEHYSNYDFDTGEIYSEKIPEYCTMSRRPGIGYEWIKRYMKDTYKDDKIIVRGKEMRPPRYYDMIHELIDPEEARKIANKRKDLSSIDKNNLSMDRMEVREKCCKARLNLKKRSYEDGEAN